MTFVVGLTGGIGSGKSLVADEFAGLGVPVVDTDAIAHELTGAGGGALPALRAVLGAECFDADGAMNRARVRGLVFRDSQARQRLEALLHPMIRRESEQRIAAAEGPYVVYVVPLLVESGSYRDRVQRVVVVDCPESEQIARVKARSGLAEDEVRRIMATQVGRKERLAAADDVIDNSGAPHAVRTQVAALHLRYLDLAGRARPTV